MTYEHVVPAVFLDRPNRFIAHVSLDGRTETVHVKNTGRCRELLLPGSEVFLSVSDNPARKTKYDLIAVRKSTGVLFNIDSQAPNRVAGEWLSRQAFDRVVPEYRYGASRLDFYMRRGAEEYLMEVKGCTLELEGTGYFPDAPTERGTKHLRELTEAVKKGYRAVIAFVIGYGIESTAMVILYKVGCILAEYVRERTLLSAEELLRYRDSEEIDRTVDTANKPGAGETASEDQIRSAASFVLKILLGFAVLFAVVAPLLTHLTYREAIHRALSIMVVATPASVLLSIPLAGLVSVFTAARSGAFFNKARSVEKLGEIKTLRSGDADGNGKVDAEDARLILRHAVALEAISFAFRSNADVNSDGMRRTASISSRSSAISLIFPASASRSISAELTSFSPRRNCT